MEDKHSKVLLASAPDIRAIASLLRGICLNTSNQRALMTINDTGLEVVVQEARTLSGTAWIDKGLFDEFVYNGEKPGSDDEDEQPAIATAFSFQLHTLLECLNVFGTATGLTTAQKTNRPAWRLAENPDNDDEEQGPRAAGNQARRRDHGSERIDSFFPRADGKGTAMRLSYTGYGNRLSVILYDSRPVCELGALKRHNRAESSSGPTTKCELATYEAEDWLEIDFNTGNIRPIDAVLQPSQVHTEGQSSYTSGAKKKPTWEPKSSWLRDALSEVDPTCDKITFVGNPSVSASERQRNGSQPQLRIHTVGPFGSAEMDFPNDKEVLEVFECNSNVSFSYRFPLILKSMRALQSSNKASIRVDEDGVLSLQFLTTSSSPSSKAPPVNSIVEFRCLSIDDSM